MNHVHAVESSSAVKRLSAARTFLQSHTPNGDVLLVGATRGAVDDLARSLAVEAGATIGLHRFSINQLAARLAAPLLAADNLAPSPYLASEAIAARAAFDASQDRAIEYFTPVVSTPGFPRALARTLQELRLAEVPAGALSRLPLGGPDLAELLDRFEQQFASASAGDRATLFDTATRALASRTLLLFGGALPPLLLLDVPMDTRREFAFVHALLQAAPAACVTVPFGDIQALARLQSIGLHPQVVDPEGTSDLAALHRYLFARTRPPTRTRTGELAFFSAPGEGRECVEIARRIIEEARGGVPFDEMAVFLRAPERYVGLLEHAFKRVDTSSDEVAKGIPAWFDRGTRRPNPSGRAFLALLACACEKLSAKRFAEYLSLAQVPPLDRPAPTEFVVPDDESLGVVTEVAPALDLPEVPPESARPDVGDSSDTADDVAVVDGSLRAPWKWETLIVESAVIGGDPRRWHRRLDGLTHEYQVKIHEEKKEDPDSPRAKRLERDLRNLGHLRAFALPVIDLLASWPVTATWGEWLDRFTEMAPLVLRQPERVLRALAELRPMSTVGPVSLVEARDVIAERLLTLESEPPRSRYGRVFVGSPQQARGRTFRVVFVPGLAERMFPQKPHEDPMLLDDEMRVPLASGLPVQEDRGRAERLLLRLAVGAATERIWFSYPRIDVAESRPRVPSFYALDVLRAITGSIPNHEDLQGSAAAEGGASLAWPSPADPARAIDDLEHDLAVLRQLLQAEYPAKVRGHAHYLLRLNDALRRSVSARWSRARSQWTPFDGITRITSVTGPALAKHRLAARPYSLSALQKFAACPYQFLLSAIYRLEPAEEPEPLQKLDPLTRGALFHEVQAEFYRRMQADKHLPITQSSLPQALTLLDEITRTVAEKYRETLAPAIDRVWRDEIADIGKDLRVWVRRQADASEWVPQYFEYSFGLRDEGRDSRSREEPVLVDGRFLLRGSVDLIEVRRDGSALRVTDHKTGKNRSTWRTVIGGGAILQPVLYSLAVSEALDLPVTSGRLSYCTAAGAFTDHEIPINDANRRAGLEALEIIDRAIELGFLPAAPGERGCAWCDFRPVCGPNEERRIAGKPADRLGDVAALRERP